MDNWTICNKTGDFDMIKREFSVNDITARLLVNRGITGREEIEAFLHPTIFDLHPASLLLGMEKAASTMATAITDHVRIRVIGDYDVDGIMSTYILTDALRRCGADVDSYIPHRIKDGYGLNSSMIEQAGADGVGLVVTCDNGISAVEAAKTAETLGIMLIVTDHHEIPDILPKAEVIIDAKQTGDCYPCRDICGAVVAAKVAEAVSGKMGTPYAPDRYLEYMAMATICDVVPLIGENRTIAKLGIEKLKKTDNPGLKFLMEENTLDMESLSEYHVGYILGPCFNATGRIDDAGLALRMLQTRDTHEAAVCAHECRELNEERKQMTAEQEKLAYAELAKSPVSDVIVLRLDSCHESIMGIIAGRIKERYNRPAIVVTKSGENLKGSCRSIPAYNMFEELKKCSDLLLKFGGHPMAAGLTLREEDLEAFRERLLENSTLTEKDMQRKMLIDAEVSFGMFDEKALSELAMLAPFGTPNYSPLFAERGLTVKSIKRMGRDGNFLRFKLADRYTDDITGVCFNDADQTLAELSENHGEIVSDDNGVRCGELSVTAAYVPKLNVFRDVSEIQMNIRSLR